MSQEIWEVQVEILLYTYFKMLLSQFSQTSFWDQLLCQIWFKSERVITGRSWAGRRTWSPFLVILYK